jgi:hypothetical protein
MPDLQSHTWRTKIRSMLRLLSSQMAKVHPKTSLGNTDHGPSRRRSPYPPKREIRTANVGGLKTAI